MKQYMKKKKGLTLIELIVVLAITPVILATIFSTINIGYNYLISKTRISNVQEQSKVMLNTLSQHLKNSRDYLDSEATNSDSRFSSLPGTKVCYIESYDGNRYLYSLEDNSGAKQLRLYILPSIIPDNYSTKPGSEYIISENEYERYIGTCTDLDYVDAYAQNRIALTSPDILDRIVTYPSGYTPLYFLYDDYEWQMYLLARKITSGEYYKIALITEKDERISPNSNKVIMKNIVDVEIKKDTRNDKKCHIRVKAMDGNAEKELKSDVYIFEKM